MKNIALCIKLLCCAVMFFLPFSGILNAQTCDGLYTTSKEIDSLREGQLSVEIDNLAFFKDNEFNTSYQKGYTLPGFWLQAKASYYPLHNMKLEAGVHSIWFWGTTRYPAFAYRDISTWRGQDYSHNVHVLPYFRAHLSLSENVDIVLGDIYGGSNHGLIEPLYNKEFNLTADPEAGAQLLYKSKWLDLDTWVDWQTYIYRLDTHQEAFIVGLSSRFKANSPKSLFHVYFPLQGISQHRGGEIDSLSSNVQTIMNGTAGIGCVWNAGRNVLSSLNAEFDILGYTFPMGCTWPIKRGAGYYAKLSAQMQDFNIKTSYWWSNNYMPIYGSAFYGALSTKEAGKAYRRPQMLYVGGEYVRKLAKGFVLGIMADWYYHLSGGMYSIETGQKESLLYGYNTNFSVGICLRINPSFLLKQY